MKKSILSLALALLLVMAAHVTAFAHGGHGGRNAVNNYPLCPIEECFAERLHWHDGSYYKGQFCPIEECFAERRHWHDGEYYRGQFMNDERQWYQNTQSQYRGGCRRL